MILMGIFRKGMTALSSATAVAAAGATAFYIKMRDSDICDIEMRLEGMPELLELLKYIRDLEPQVRANMMNYFVKYGHLLCWSCAVLCFFRTQNWKRKCLELESIPTVGALRDLRDLTLPTTVAVTARVGYEDSIPAGLNAFGPRGFFTHTTVNQHLLQRDVCFAKCKGKANQKLKCEVDDTWKQRSRLITSDLHEIPSWYLDDGTDRVFVAGARACFDLILPAGRPRFENATENIMHESSHGIQLEKVIGLETTQRMLQVGTVLSIVGQAFRDNRNNSCIQLLRKWPFFVSSESTFEEYIEQHRNSRRWSENAFLALSICSGCVTVLAVCYMSDDFATRSAQAFQRLISSFLGGRSAPKVEFIFSPAFQRFPEVKSILSGRSF